jgi:phage shock protein C
MSEVKRLYRSKNEKMIAGVAGGLAEYLDLDPTIIRLLFVVLLFVGGGGGVIYILMMLIVPELPETADVVEIDEKKK